MASAERHREISEYFLAHSHQQLESGDFLQASEKGWGAVVHCIKAIARERDWPNKSHGDVRNNALRLLEQSAAPVTNTGVFKAVERLHVNFYEESLKDDEVRLIIAGVKALTDILNSVDARMPR